MIIKIILFLIGLLLGVIIGQISVWRYLDIQEGRKLRSCKDCYWCRYSSDTKYLRECKLISSNKYNHPEMHGWFCRFYNH